MNRGDFGETEEGSVVEHSFKFTNTGSVPLIISGARSSCGRQWASLAYTDINPNVYGTPGVSSYTVIDAKVLYHVAKQWTGALGVNNLGNYKYYVQPNPYPQRTLFASLKFDY